MHPQLQGLSVLTRDQFNYLIPAGLVRFFSITRTGSRWAERVVTHDATFRVLSSLRVSFWKKIVPLEPSWLQNLRQSDLLNRLITDIDTLDNVYLRLLNPFNHRLCCPPVFKRRNLLLSFVATRSNLRWNMALDADTLPFCILLFG